MIGMIRIGECGAQGFVESRRTHRTFPQSPDSNHDKYQSVVSEIASGYRPAWTPEAEQTE